MSIQRSILILYNAATTYTNTIWEHLASFALFSRYRIFYAHLDETSPFQINLANFDAVILHYSVRLPFDQVSPACARALRAFQGVKVVFQQDEYEFTEKLRRWLEELGVAIMFTCVPRERIPEVYAPGRFSRTRFISNLTGYVPLDLQSLPPPKRVVERKNHLGYRGRPLPYWLGELGQEKIRIGQRMQAECMRRNIPADISWAEEDRIYGPAWYEFIRDCRAMLGSESGANVFDEDGSLRTQIREALAAEPSLSYEEVARRFLVGREIQRLMNQVSPKIFEAIALRTALVLFEGNYSGVVRPWVHYISLNKDFSNVDEVLDAVQDIGLLERMTERAYIDVIEIGIYSYGRFIAGVDEAIGDALSETGHRSPAVASISQEPRASVGAPTLLSTFPIRAGDSVDDQCFGRLAALVWSKLPEPVRVLLRPIARPARLVMSRVLRGSR